MELRHNFSELKGQLEAYSSDLTILQIVSACEEFSVDEREELKQLFGLKILDLKSRFKNKERDWLRKRQRHWNNVVRSSSNTEQQTIARHAVERLGNILFATSEESKRS